MSYDPNTGIGLLSQLEACERQVWDALVQGDMTADKNALDDAFLGVYSDGFSGKNAHVRQLSNGPTIETYQLSDTRVLHLGSQHALLSYRADFRRVAKTANESMYVSSIWQRLEHGWVNVFSQDTPAAN